MKPALHFPRIGKTLLAAALVAMAGTAAAGKAIEGDIDAAKALAFLYGNQAKASPVFDAKYTEHGKEKYIMLTKTGADPNTGGDDIFGAAVFANNGGQWTLEVENRNIPQEPLCRLDNDDKPILARVGSDKHGILIHASLGGSRTNYECPTVLLPDGGSIRSVLIGEFASGICSDGMVCGEIQVRASFDEQSAGEYYDAVVRYIDVGNKGKAGSRRFQFRDGEYHEVASPKAAKKGGKKGAKKRK